MVAYIANVANAVRNSMHARLALYLPRDGVDSKSFYIKWYNIVSTGARAFTGLKLHLFLRSSCFWHAEKIWNLILE